MILSDVLNYDSTLFILYHLLEHFLVVSSPLANRQLCNFKLSVIKDLKIACYYVLCFVLYFLDRTLVAFIPRLHRSWLLILHHTT